MKILITGASGFIGGYLVSEFLEHRYDVTGIDNYSKYGKIGRISDGHPRYTLYEGDAKNTDTLLELAKDCDVIVAGAAKIGGISYFHRYAYDLIAENERILGSTFDAAIESHKAGTLKKIVVISSSMVFESTDEFPSPEGAELRSPPPKSTYGFQKLAAEYFAYGAFQQYGLPYTIVRPFNCVGIGEYKSLDDEKVKSGNIELTMSHALPDLAYKILKGQNPIEILGNGQQIRCYTHGRDLARGIRLATEKDAALNNDFNISTDRKTTVLELAELIWNTCYDGSQEFRYTCADPFPHDVQIRVPMTNKAEEFLGFRAEVPLEDSVTEVVDWLRKEIARGTI